MLSKITRLFALEWSRLLQYRADLFMWMAAESAIPLVSLAIWYTIAQTKDAPLSALDTFTYYIIIMFVIIITNAWNGFFLARSILNGDIAQYLTRPISPFWPHIANDVLEKGMKLLIPLPVLLVIIYRFPRFFSPAIFEPRHLGLFLISLLLAALLAFVLDMHFGVLAFWLEDATQLRRYKDILQQATSGILIPLAFIPATIKPIFAALPFRYIISAPAEILLGQAEGTAAFHILLTQAMWTGTLLITLTLLWRRGLKIYAVPGQ